MVIVQLNGGLGNQLFQYAAGRALAYRRKTRLKLDTSALEGTIRSYGLAPFRISAKIATPSEVARITNPPKDGLRAASSAVIERLFPRLRPSVLVERHFHFDPAVLEATGRIYMIGYWQSEKYFADIEDLLRKELTLKDPPDGPNAGMLRRISESDSVGVHVRRGDYVSTPTTHDYHGLCSQEYYLSAVQTLTQSVSGRLHFFVFSDDPTWARRNLKLDYPLTHVAHNGPEKDCEDLRLMCRCRHHIIANSTFGWWGAWLCAHPGKTVIAPAKWFDKATHDSRDLIPPSWIRV